MRLRSLFVFRALLAFAASDSSSEPSASTKYSSLYGQSFSPSNVLHDRDTTGPGTVDVDKEWEKAWCKGSKLALAMLNSEDKASTYITPIRSPWDGTLESDFTTWGYREIDGYRNLLCDFSGSVNNLERAFGDLGIGTKSSDKSGPNKCYHVEHQSGPTVETDKKGKKPEPDKQWYTAGGRRMRVTQAYTDLGINSDSGAIYFFNRLSPREAAHKKWKIPYDKIKPEQLPDLSSSSDFAWGYWNREHSDGVGLENIKFIFMCSIVNEVTLALIDRALKTYPLPPGVTERPKEVQAWPGTTFEMEYDAAQVLLGSPNGQAAGFFLSQHKHRFGKNKSVDKITVFCPDSGGHPYLLFWVIDAPTVPDKGDADFGDNDSGYDSGAEVVEGNGRTDSAVFLPDVMNRTLRHEVEHRILKVGEDGKNVVREHVFRAKTLRRYK